MYSGLTLGLAAVLIGAAGAKSLHVSRLELTVLARIVPKIVWRLPLARPERLARAVIAAELLTAAALLFSPLSWAPAVTILALLVFTGFFIVLVVARRRQVPCNCFGRSAHAVGLLDLARGAVLLLAAGSLAGLSLVGSGVSPGPGIEAFDLSTTSFAVVAVIITVFAAPSTLRGLRGHAVQARMGSAAPLGGARVPRRAFIARAAMTGFALLVVRLVPGTNSALALSPGECFFIFDACMCCCDEKANKNACYECCLQCYNRCVGDLDPCDDDQCQGCWGGHSTTH